MRFERTVGGVDRGVDVGSGAARRLDEGLAVNRANVVEVSSVLRLDELTLRDETRRKGG